MMEPVKGVVPKLLEHAEKRRLVAVPVGERLHITVDPRKLEELRGELSELVNRENGFKKKAEKVSEKENVLFLSRGTRHGLSRLFNIFSNNDFELKLIRSRGLPVKGKPTESAYLSFSAPDHHAITPGQYAFFTKLLDVYALKQQKE